MPIIDQHVTWRKVEERLAVETDPVLRRNLELLLTHMKGEASLDLDAVSAACSRCSPCVLSIGPAWPGASRASIASSTRDCATASCSAVISPVRRTISRPYRAMRSR